MASGNTNSGAEAARRRLISMEGHDAQLGKYERYVQISKGGMAGENARAIAQFRILAAARFDSS